MQDQVVALQRDALRFRAQSVLEEQEADEQDCSFTDVAIQTTCVDAPEGMVQRVVLDYTTTNIPDTAKIDITLVNDQGNKDERLLPVWPLTFDMVPGEQFASYTLRLSYVWEDNVSCTYTQWVSMDICQEQVSSNIQEDSGQAIELCSNGEDDDGDARVDCLDDDCSTDSACNASSTTSASPQSVPEVSSDTQICGNRIIEWSETCDDWNLMKGDGCNDICLVEFCGDGYADPDGPDNNLASSIDNEECGEPGLSCESGFKCIASSCVCMPDTSASSDPVTSPIIDDEDDIPVPLPQPDGLCGARHESEIYDVFGDGSWLDETTVGLCSSSATAINFIFDRRKKVWQWLCITLDDQRDTCYAEALWCGDGDRNGEEICEGDDDSFCAETEVCSTICTCIPYNENGVCGAYHEQEYYSLIDEPRGLTGRGDDFCGGGDRTAIEYDEQYDAWYRTCAGIGSWFDAACYTYRTYCGNGFVEEDETCDDGNIFDGDGCDKRCRVEWWVNLGWWAVAVAWCGDGIVDLEEQCDDGNLLSGDGCSDTCSIEDGWKCTTDSPSACGSLECTEHGDWYAEYNIRWSCCGGLQALDFEKTPDKLISSGVQLTLCYDDDIAAPLCYPRKDPSWRYIPMTPDGEPELMLEDVCAHTYQNYYDMIDGLFGAEVLECQYDDALYESVDFKDIQAHANKVPILTLLDSCIVKWPGTWYLRYQPDKAITRAEFTKMLIKTVFLWFEYGVTREDIPYAGETYFTDVPQDFWWAQYIAKAYEMWLLKPLVGEWQTKSDTFSPHAKLSRNDALQILFRAEVGKNMRMAEMQDIIWPQSYPSRGAVAALLVEKFDDRFSSYVSTAWYNGVYFEVLRRYLKGKPHSEQYMTILQQIDRMQENEELHGAALSLDLDIWSIAGYLWWLVGR